MSAEIATFERVRDAVAQLHKDEKRATADAVFDIIGGGSRPTILKHLKTLREGTKPAEGEMPPALVDQLRPVLAQIFAEGGKAEMARNRDQSDRLHRILGDLEAEVEALAKANLALEARISDLGEQLVGKTEELSTAEEANATKDRRIEQLQADLAARDDVARKNLDDTLRGFDEKLAILARQMEQAGSSKGRADGKGHNEGS